MTNLLDLQLSLLSISTMFSDAFRGGREKQESCLLQSETHTLCKEEKTTSSFINAVSYKHIYANSMQNVS